MADSARMVAERPTSADALKDVHSAGSDDIGKPVIDDINQSCEAHEPSYRYSEGYIYGDASADAISRDRTSNQAEIRSQAVKTSFYQDEALIIDDGDDNEHAGEEFETKDPELVTWNGPTDPENPRNWRIRRKTKVSLFASLQTLIVTMTSSILAPTIPRILASYHNSNETVGSFMLCIMVLVWGFSALVAAPLTEVFGRRIVLLVSGFGNLAFNIACATSPTTATMLVFRALAGVFNVAPLAMSAGVLADVFDDKDRQWPLGIWALGPSCGPGIAPIIGGWIAEKTTWHWAFWSIVIAQGSLLVAMFFFYDESLPQMLLARRKQRLIQETGNENLHTIWDLVGDTLSRKLKLAIVRPVLILTLNPVVLLLAIYLGYTYGFMYLILTDFPALWADVYHYSSGIGGLMYIGYTIGMLVGLVFWVPMINWRYERQEKLGKGKLEERLFMLPLATILLAAGMFWYGWSAEAKLSWPMPTVGISIFSFSIFSIFQCVQSYVVSMNAQHAASATSTLVLFRCMLGGTFPLFGRAMYNRLGYGWASTVVALLAIVLGIPWPICIYLYGEKLRRWVDNNVHIA